MISPVARELIVRAISGPISAELPPHDQPG
jgi:hypothetical protein